LHERIDWPSVDLRRDFPDMTGLSARNLKYIRALAEAHPDRAFVQQLLHDCRGVCHPAFGER
jgi:hypothetical protein